MPTFHILLNGRSGPSPEGNLCSSHLAQSGLSMSPSSKLSLLVIRLMGTSVGIGISETKVSLKIGYSWMSYK